MGHLVLRNEDDREQLRSLVAQLDLAKPWEFSWGREKKHRSLNQNALMHKWFGIIADEIGDDRESVKHDYKMMFLGKIERVSHVTGEVMMEPRSTSDLSAAECSEFMNKVQAHATSQLGILLPAEGY